MGFFIGWRYFEEKDRYSFEARQEQQRLRREQDNKKRKEAKQEQIRKKKKAEKKKRLQEEWRQEAASYQNDQFGLETNPYKSGYINEDGESYKEQITKQYGLSEGDLHTTQTGLNRGMAGVGARMKKSEGESPFDPKNTTPAGMNAPGMEGNPALQDGRQAGASKMNNKKGMGGSSCNPMGGGLGRSKNSGSGIGSSGGNFTGKLNRPI